MVRFEVGADWEEQHMRDEVEAIQRMLVYAQTARQEMTGRATRLGRPPTRRSSRLGAVAVPPPQTGLKATPPFPFLSPPLPPTLPVRQADGTIQVDEDNVRLPRSFPPVIYSHTPCTTLLSDPSLEEPPPPPPPAHNPTEALELLRKLKSNSTPSKSWPNRSGPTLWSKLDD